ncbi:TetR/AcrR family transcriptional regulator [Aquabacterium sp.]|uniref:TetR/AcrR family transcriptional regulator n=1 Tax=Aquabacterium sp. TaxID=1872578 RepID=UPI002CC453A8|nr:TetR/AcrR family transcriptional regulator [Aquabacterium sp.]HSW06184.1 TetR/AcrR family transcriptional regulator [Aquabacterium sp.]
MGRVRTAAFDDQREAILAQAAALFAHQGYTATSMNQVAAACGISKPTLYHYVRDKHELLLCVARAHVGRLQSLVAEVRAETHSPRDRLAQLIARFVRAYADAQNEHRVLTEDVKFLDADARERVLGGEREVVAAFADAVTALRPDLAQAALATPLTMLLFGMINWMFTWLKPEGPIRHDAMAPVVVDLFLGGLAAVQVPPPAKPAVKRSRPKTPKKETCA